MHGSSLQPSETTATHSAGNVEAKVTAGRAIYFPAKGSGKLGGWLSVLKSLALQLLALPMGLVFGRPREAL
ncbi:hypothetical protein COEREDRAFT_83668, partial [Coemansia reversa NRRL 1564]